MALINFDYGELVTGRARRYGYAGVSPGDTLEILHLRAPAAFACIQVEGLSGSTLSVRGSNDDGANSYELSDTKGQVMSITADGMREFSTAAAALEFTVAGGAESGTITIAVVTWE